MFDTIEIGNTFGINHLNWNATLQCMTLDKHISCRIYLISCVYRRRSSITNHNLIFPEPRVDNTSTHPVHWMRERGRFRLDASCQSNDVSVHRSYIRSDVFATTWISFFACNERRARSLVIALHTESETSQNHATHGHAVWRWISSKFARAFVNRVRAVIWCCAQNVNKISRANFAMAIITIIMLNACECVCELWASTL